MENQKHLKDEDIQQLIAKLREWLEQKPYVPKNIEQKLYRRFVHSCYYDLDKAKAAADLYFSIRSSAAELFTNRDPLSPHMQKVLKITNLCKYRISGNRNVWIWQLNDPGFQQYNHLLEAKLFNLCTDAWLLEDEFLEEEDILIADAKDLSIKIFMRFSFSIAKNMFKYQQEALPIRLTQVHIINAPSVMSRLFSIIKPFVKKEIMEAIHFHVPKSTTLYEYLSGDDLLEEFGGTRGRLSDYDAETKACIMRKREYLIDDDLWRIDQNKDTNKREKADSNSAADATPGINSLRTLVID